MNYNILTVSTKGQISIPIDIRKRLGIEEGTKISIYCDGNNIVLKPLPKLTYEEFQLELQKAQEWAKEVGLKEEDIDRIIKEVRKEKREGRR